jgi:esterase/lipase superfamily enzyme
MELLIFGHAGAPVIFFPTRTARFYDYENWKIIEAMRHKIESGSIQVYCIDSIDLESFYNEGLHPSRRILRHMEFDRYITDELIPFIQAKNPNPHLIAAGCSLGAYHAINVAFKHPELFSKVVGMSGRYDLTNQINEFRDLFNGYTDENIYYNMPSRFIPHLNDPEILSQLKKLEIIIAIGIEDPFYDNNKHLSTTLWEKGVWNAFHVWDGEAHRPRYWRQMVQHYL